MTKIKICGLKRREDISYVNLCKPDYAGFVFAGTKRRITEEQARELCALLSPEIVRVGVFVNEEVDVVARLMQEHIIDMAQLHGTEDETYLSTLKEKTNGGKIIKAIRVASPESIVDCERWDADYLLFDKFSKKEYGGTGETFDWSILGKIPKPFFLAGGINMENVETAIKTLHPYAVDVSSAVETNGCKDREKILNMVARVRNYSKQF